MHVHIRWMMRRDLPEVLKIERASFPAPWTEEDFLGELRQFRNIGIVAEIEERIVGYMIYEYCRHELKLLNFAVAPSARRSGVGVQMAQKLVNKLHGRRNRIILEVRETNVAAQLFFRATGFRATCVLKARWGREDAYQMEYRLNEGCTPVNRISGLIIA